MRVLHVIARLNAGGTAVYLENLSIGLTQSGVENMIATGYVQNGEIEDQCIESLPIIRIPDLGRAISPLKDFRARRDLQRIIKDFKPDIIHSHTFKAGMLSRSLRSSIRRVHTFHGHILNDGSLNFLERFLVIFLEQIFAKRTDALISVGENIGNELRALRIGSQSAWQSIPPGINPPILIDRKDAANKIGANPYVKTVGWLGRMVPVKDPALAIEVARVLSDLQFIVAGDGELFQDLIGSAPGNVILPGWVDRLDVLSCSDLILITSLSEGMPLSAIEALLADIPIVAPNVGSMSEVVSGENGGLSDSRTVDELVRRVRELIRKPELFSSTTSKRKTQWLQKFSIKHTVDAHIVLYQSLINNDKTK